MKNNISLTSIKIPNELFFSELKDIIQKGNKVKIFVVGNSMSPFLRSGDLVILSKFENKHLSCGEIVLAYYNSSYILHRIVKITRNIIILSGDGNLSQVEKINSNDILAVVIDAYRDSNSIKFKDTRWKIWYKLRFFRRIYSKIFRQNENKKGSRSTTIG